jgi:hypothetical protein
MNSLYPLWDVRREVVLGIIRPSRASINPNGWYVCPVSPCLGCVPLLGCGPHRMLAKLGVKKSLFKPDLSQFYSLLTPKQRRRLLLIYILETSTWHFTIQVHALIVGTVHATFQGSNLNFGFLMIVKRLQRLIVCDDDDTSYPLPQILNLQQVLGRIYRLLSFHYILSVWYDMDRVENTAYSTPVVVCVIFAAGTCLSSCCLVTLRGGDRHTARDLINLFFFFKIMKVS